jgi:hypothetical protein
MLAPIPASAAPMPSLANAAAGGDGTVTGASGAVPVPPQASFLSLLETFTVNHVRDLSSSPSCVVDRRALFPTLVCSAARGLQWSLHGSPNIELHCIFPAAGELVEAAKLSEISSGRCIRHTTCPPDRAGVHVAASRHSVGFGHRGASFMFRRSARRRWTSTRCFFRRSAAVATTR